MCLRVVLCGKQGMEGAAAEVVVVGADGSETSFTFDALVHSEDGESMHADPHSGRPPNLVKRLLAERALRHSWLDAAGDFMSTRVQYVNNDILTDCVLTKDWQVLEVSPILSALLGRKQQAESKC